MRDKDGERERIGINFSEITFPATLASTMQILHEAILKKMKCCLNEGNNKWPN